MRLKALRLTCLLLGLFLPLFTMAAQMSLQEAKQRMKRLNVQIDKTEQSLHKANQTRADLIKAIEKTEQSIQNDEKQLKTIVKTLKEKQHSLKALQVKANDLNDTLSIQQQRLSAHLQAHYRLGQREPMKWLMLHDDAVKIDQLLTFYHYMVLGCQRTIKTVQDTQFKLDQIRATHQREVTAIKKTEQKCRHDQQALARKKTKRKSLLTKLEHSIQSDEIKLAAYQKDKQALSELLQTLAKKSTIQTRRSFSQRRKQLPPPVNTKRTQSLNQGTLYLAKAGSSVNAIYPGKVVFSDWLKGYGLLIIIDHGWGYMTLYAYNQSLHKRLGDTVQQGEQIAEVGHSGTLPENGLYFEIRHHGKAIAPNGWLS